jgi:hypothetical protein
MRAPSFLRSCIPGCSQTSALALLGLLGSWGLVPLLAPPARANMMQQIIVSKCSDAMQADFKKAGKTPPNGMVGDTCSCVADGMLQHRQSLDEAKATCVNQATQKYGAI